MVAVTSDMSYCRQNFLVLAQPFTTQRLPAITAAGRPQARDVTEPIILLVEDEPLVLLVAQDALEAGGYTVLPVQHASEALILLDQRCDDVAGLVTDIRLPGGSSGWDIARHARELKANIPVVYTTGDSAADWPVQGVPNSVIVQKPYAAAQLLTAISALMIKTDTDGGSPS